MPWSQYLWQESFWDAAVQAKVAKPKPPKDVKVALVPKMSPPKAVNAQVVP